MSFTNYGKAELILPGFGANGGTSFPDYSKSNRIITPGGSVQTSTAQFNYYDSSILFNGTTDYLSTPSFNLYNIDFAIFCRIYLNNINKNQIILTTYHTPTQSNTTYFGIDNTNHLLAGNGLASAVSTSIVSVSTWYNVALLYDSVTTTHFVALNGTIENSVVGATTAEYTTTYIGGSPGDNNIGTRWFDGYMQDIIVWRGTRQWTADFTPPTALVGTTSGTTYDKLGNPAARDILVLPRDLITRVFSTTSNGTTGAYSLTSPAIESLVIALEAETPRKFDLFARETPA